MQQRCSHCNTACLSEPSQTSQLCSTPHIQAFRALTIHHISMVSRASRGHVAHRSGCRLWHADVLEWLWFLNSYPEVIYRTMYGDKDTFRLAFHLAGKADMFSQASSLTLTHVMVPLCFDAVHYHTIPYHTVPYHTIPYHTIPYHTIPYHTIPYHTVPYHTTAANIGRSAGDGRPSCHVILCPYRESQHEQGSLPLTLQL
jgi:hypothetical protein